MVGGKIMIEVWQVDITDKYFVDEDYNIFITPEDFYEYHFEDYHGTKDNYEQWCSDIEEEYGLEEKSGIEITHYIYNELKETIEWYRNHDRNK